jgi:hypothetical protein
MFRIDAECCLYRAKRSERGGWPARSNNPEVMHQVQEMALVATTSPISW